MLGWLSGNCWIFCRRVWLKTILFVVFFQVFKIRVLSLVKWSYRRIKVLSFVKWSKWLEMDFILLAQPCHWSAVESLRNSQHKNMRLALLQKHRSRTTNWYFFCHINGKLSYSPGRRDFGNFPLKVRHHSVSAKPLVELDLFAIWGKSWVLTYLRNVVHQNECSVRLRAR